MKCGIEIPLEMKVPQDLIYEIYDDFANGLEPGESPSFLRFESMVLDEIKKQMRKKGLK